MYVIYVYKIGYYPACSKFLIVRREDGKDVYHLGPPPLMCSIAPSAAFSPNLLSSLYLISRPAPPVF